MAEATNAGSYKTPPLVDEIVRKWEDSKKHHDVFARRYERNERAYRGVLESSSEAAKWKHKYHPPYAFNLIETIVSNTIEMGLRFDVRPSPHSNIGMEEAVKLLVQADAVGDLLRHEHRVDEMDFKQRPLFLSASICGTGIGKSYWNYTEGAVRRQGVRMEPVQDADGNTLLEVPVIGEILDSGALRDHSTFEVVDPRDFVLHESAKALQPWEPGGAQYAFHRVWYSMEQLKQLERDGFFKNVDALVESRDHSGEYRDRETEVFQIERTKDLLEVLEYWCFKDGKVHRAYVGQSKVLLRDEEESPFWHGGYPFVISSSMPQLFSTRGMSDVELIEQLQTMLWKTANQRFDNLELINNFITLIRSDVDDPDAFEFYPGARWPVDGDVNSAVAPLQPPYQLAEISLSTEAQIKGDLQNVTSAAPFASGAETATVDQKTATGASIVMNAAQQRLVSKKYQAQQGLREEASMRIKLLQQFITDKKLVHVIGPDGKTTFREIDPLSIQGDYGPELEPMGESQMRQERRSEAMQFFQVVMQSAPVLAAGGAPLNLREVFGWMSKKWGIEDWERFLSQQQGAMGAVQGMPGGGQGGPAQGGGIANPQEQMQPNLGITSDQSIDASSPSAAGGISSSPVAALQRAMAMGGGVNNGGGSF